MDYSKFSDDTIKKLSKGEALDYGKLTDDELSELSAAGSASGALSETLPQAPISTPEVDTGPWEAAARGVEQGALMGFGDELHGALGAGYDKLTGSDTDLLDLYRQNRDASRTEFKAAEEAHPYISGAGNLAGGLASGLATGGAAMGFKGAVGLGALSGLGTSEADVTNLDAEQAKKLAADVAIGGTVGGLVGAAADKVGSSLARGGKNLLGAGKAIVKAPSELGVVHGLAEAGKQGLKGRKLWGVEGEKALKKEAGALSESLGTNIAKEASEAMSQQKSLISDADPVAIKGYYDQAMKSLENAHKYYDGDEKVQKEILKLRDRLGSWVLGTKDARVKVAGKDWKMEPMDALHLKRLMGRFGSAAEQDSLVTGEAQNIANRLIRSPDLEGGYVPSFAEDVMGAPGGFKGIHDVMEESVPGLGGVNDRIHSLLEAEKIRPGTSALLGTEKSGVSGITSQESVDKFLNTLPNDVKEKLAPQISDIAKAVKVREKISAKTLADKGILGSIDVGMKGALYGAANAVGYGAQSIYKMSPQGAQNAAKWVRTNVVNKGGDKLASMLDMVASKEGAGRNAILFSIQQNPEYRAILEKLTGSNPVKEQNEK